MSDSDAADEIDAIRERKVEDLKRQLESPDEPVHVESESHFDEILADHSPVLVDFYADWCGPCKMLEPVVESVAAGTGATVAKVDVDAHQGLAGQYEVQGVPTMYLFVDGQPVERLVGVQDEQTLVDLIESNS